MSVFTKANGVPNFGQPGHVTNILWPKINFKALSSCNSKMV